MRKFAFCFMLLLPIFTCLLMYVGVKIISYSKDSDYVVAFYDWDNSVYNTQTVEDISQVVFPSPPKRPGYVFVKWDYDMDKNEKTIKYFAVYQVDGVASEEVYYVAGNSYTIY